MTDDLTLARPWSLSDHDARHDAVKRLPTGPEQRATAEDALAACLRFVGTADDPDDLPEVFYDHWFVLAGRFMRRMPELADVTPAAVGEWLAGEEDAEEIFGPAPYPAEEVRRFWMASFADRVTDELIRWLAEALRHNGSGPERERFVALLEAAVPSLPWRRGVVAVAAIRDLGAAESLRRIEGDPNTPAETRQEAADARSFLERRS